MSIYSYKKQLNLPPNRPGIYVNIAQGKTCLHLSGSLECGHSIRSPLIRMRLSRWYVIGVRNSLWLNLYSIITHWGVCERQQWFKVTFWYLRDFPNNITANGLVCDMHWINYIYMYIYIQNNVSVVFQLNLHVVTPLWCSGSKMHVHFGLR